MNFPDTYLSIFLRFLRFGFLAWGGPVAQIAMIKDELVDREKWVDSAKFNRVLALYQALPGPEAHELCVYFGMVRRGRMGGFLAGLGFMLPGFVLVLLLAWLYTLVGAAALLPLFAGVYPAVAALIVRAVHRIGSHTLGSRSLWVAAVAAACLTLLGVHFMAIFVICASWQALWEKGRRGIAVAALAGLAAAFLVLPLVFGGETAAGFTKEGGGLFVEGLKAGLLSFGGAYTAIPFLEDAMVGVYEGVSMPAFLDGIALSSVIPAPTVIFGTFLGYLADGLAGALLVTLGIFIPAFSFTLIGHNFLEKLIENTALHGMLDGVAAAVTGLLAVTAGGIVTQTLVGSGQIFIFSGALFALFLIRRKWATPAVILFCGVAGFAFGLGSAYNM